MMKHILFVKKFVKNYNFVPYSRKTLPVLTVMVNVNKTFNCQSSVKFDHNLTKTSQM